MGVRLKTSRFWLVPAVCLATVVCSLEATYCQEVPFRSVGTNNAYNPATAVFGGGGITTHMGRTTGAGLAIPTPTLDPLIFDWSGGGEFVTPNGDKTFFSGGGQVFLNPLGRTMFTATWAGAFTIDGGTGRFSNVSSAPGALDVVAVNHPFDIVSDSTWFYDYTIEGNIDLGRKGGQ